MRDNNESKDLTSTDKEVIIERQRREIEQLKAKVAELLALIGHVNHGQYERTVEPFLREIREKDAKIERLRSAIESQNKAIDKHLSAGERKDKLITELADALRIRIPGSYNEQDLDDLELCKRAREASKE